MVDYRGPQLLRPLVQGLDVEMFNRITRIKIDYVSDLSTRLGKHDLSTLDDLDHVSLTRVFYTPDNLKRITELKNSIPCEKIKLEPQAGKFEMMACSM